MLFEDLRKPARAMIARAFGSALGPEEIEDIYANAWTATLSALGGRTEKMSDEELRSYLLTAVANHASKEMRRRRRKPTSALEDAHAQVLSDSHQPSPEERAVGNESGSLARDVLASLPKRRRAVMLLRYGWGLQPKEVCSLIDGLSPRAYRKEITRGVEQMIERLGQAESGEWCRSRESIIRDYVAGTADPELERQATEHLGHCRHCAGLVGRLTEGLNDLGAGAAWTGVAGALAEDRLSLSDRLAALADRAQHTVAGAGGPGEGAGSTVTAVASSGGARGAGAAGAGLAAKLAGIGVAGKTAIACLGASVAATACVATGVLPAPGAGGDEPAPDGPPDRRVRVDRELTPSPTPDAIQIAEPGRGTGKGGGEGSGGDSRKKVEQEAAEPVAAEGAPLSSPAPAAAPEQQEFGLPAAASGGGGGGSGGSSSSSGGAAGGGDVAREFGP